MTSENNNNTADKSTQMLLSFWHIQKEMMRTVRNTAQSNQLSMPQYTVLLAMIQQDEMMQKQVHRLTNLPKSTLSQAIDGLVENGILERKPVETNRRKMELEISAAGKSLIKQMQMQEDGIHQLFRQAVESISDDQYDTVMEIHAHLLSELKRGESPC